MLLYWNKCVKSTINFPLISSTGNIKSLHKYGSFLLILRFTTALQPHLIEVLLQEKEMARNFLQQKNCLPYIGVSKVHLSDVPGHCTLMLCSHQTGRTFFSRWDYIQSQCKDVNRCKICIIHFTRSSWNIWTQAKDLCNVIWWRRIVLLYEGDPICMIQPAFHIETGPGGRGFGRKWARKLDHLVRSENMYLSLDSNWLVNHSILVVYACVCLYVCVCLLEEMEWSQGHVWRRGGRRRR